MATKIKIGHASISENNSVNGSAGDSTGREVYINNDFDISSLKPNVLLRPNTATLANASAEACEKGCENNNIGYSQSGRNTLYNLAKANGYNLSTVGSCNTDCSAFMTVCAIAGGSKIAYGSNAPTTSNMRTRFKQSGDYSVLTDSKHLTMTDYLKRGDILVCEGSHTVMVLENGSKSVEDTVEAEGGTSGVTPITIIKVRAIEVTLNKINKNSAVASVKILEQKTGEAPKVLGLGVVRSYSLAYTLEHLGGNTITKQIKIASNKLNLTLNSLQPEASYRLQVIAQKDGETAFCSPKVLFTTLPEKESINDTKKEFTSKATNTIDHIYLKVEDEFKPVIIYNNEV
jgi:hypothetical protein